MSDTPLPISRRAARHLARAALALASLALVACSPRTAIRVHVSSTLSVPDGIDDLEITATGLVAASSVTHHAPLERGWPQTLDVLAGPLETGGVRITVTARHEGTFVVRRVVRARFEPGTVRDVFVELTENCVGVECAPGIDCLGGECDVAGDPCVETSDCDDAVACTYDWCDDAVMRCRHDVDHATCAEGIDCDPIDGCPARPCGSDAECDDGRPCNGAETCEAGHCAPGAHVSCDDHDPCTTDRCLNELGGGCEHETRDLDDDGHGDARCPVAGEIPADDCDDADPRVHPGAAESCNGIDDDCDTAIDQPVFDCASGARRSCATECDPADAPTGEQACDPVTCSWSECMPPAETCDGTDDDCDHAIDEGRGECALGAVDEACTTTCGSTGRATCIEGCNWSACDPPDEVCNGLDDDCAGGPDDAFACVLGRETSCHQACWTTRTTTGTQTCLEGCMDSTPCVAAEGCNGVDDDCDGAIDETVACAPGALEPCHTSCDAVGARTGTHRCTDVCVWPLACDPPAETCNGRDDDCVGGPDNGFECVLGATAPCTDTACGADGVKTCLDGCHWGACVPLAEWCNGLDDDCDGSCDEVGAGSCCVGDTRACDPGCGSAGSQVCTASCGWGTCVAPAESCNGVDDDCDGRFDEGGARTCRAGDVRSCTTACSTPGTQSCSTTTCQWATTCDPLGEVCNGVDDDCDASRDEGVGDCVQSTTTRSCTTSCGSTGAQTCGADCRWPTAASSCVPPAESFNGVDDDCDARADEGFSGCFTCSGAFPVSGSGSHYGGRYSRSVSGASQHTGTCGDTGGPEAVLTVTLTATSDVFVTTHQAVATGIDTVIYVRRCACGGPEIACNDDADGFATSVLHLRDLAPDTYQIFVDTPAGTSATIPVDVYVSAPGLESDRCGDPTYAALGTTTYGTTAGFTHDYDAVNVGSDSQPELCPYVAVGNGPERVFYVVVPEAQTIVADECNLETLYDSILYVRSICESPTAASQLVCGDDVCEPGPSSSCAWYRPRVSRAVMPGVYYVFVDAGQFASCQTGPFRLDLGP